MIRQNRMIIQQMDNEATVDIETENLKCYVILENAMVLLPKHQGGGDCGIAIIDNRIDKNRIYNEWSSHGIKPLKFKIYHGQ